MLKTDKKSLLNLISEAGMLKRVRRSGWWVLGIKDAETVAEHSFRCVIIGYAIAHMEKAHPYKVLIMTLFNDLHEARLNDLHKMSQRYIDLQKAENRAFREQIAHLPKVIKGELASIRTEYRNQRSKASVIARDADILECLIQAKEYCGYGFKEAAKFMNKAPRFLRTKTAKELWQQAKDADLNEWWEGLSEFKR